MLIFTVAIEKYLKLLEDIDFNDNDELYILGDILDREGDGGIDIIQDIMGASNVRLILGMFLASINPSSAELNFPA